MVHTAYDMSILNPIYSYYVYVYMTVVSDIKTKGYDWSIFEDVSITVYLHENSGEDS
jgi:hypothetical protein